MAFTLFLGAVSHLAFTALNTSRLGDQYVIDACLAAYEDALEEMSISSGWKAEMCPSTGHVHARRNESKILSVCTAEFNIQPSR
jgi:hypothetical protein